MKPVFAVGIFVILAPMAAKAAGERGLPPKPEATAVVRFTAQEMQAIAQAMQIAAAQCAQLPGACAIGIIRGQIDAKLSEAWRRMQTAKAEK